MLKVKRTLWNSNDAGPSIKRIILKEIHKYQILRIWLNVVLVLNSIFVVPMSGDIRELFGILYIFDDIKNKSWHKYALYSLKIIQTIISLAFPTPCFIMFYSVGDCIYGIMVMREKIKLIERTFGRKNLLVQDLGYQKYVEITMKKCIYQHKLVKK